VKEWAAGVLMQLKFLISKCKKVISHLCCTEISPC